jgi:molybdopterin/thiamine biosynthesis adenylyltransferase
MTESFNATNVSFLRHGAFFGPEDSQDKVLNIIGVGATGSWVGLLAAKMGWQHFRVWDADIVESHNLPNQIYDLEQVGLPKVTAFKQKLLQFNPEVVVETNNKFFLSEQDKDNLEDYVFVAVDSLSARKDIIEGVRSHLLLDYVIETRMGFEHAEINIIDPAYSAQIDSYLSTLKTDEEVTESACDARIITTLTCIVSSSVVHTLCGLAAQDRHGETYTPQPKQIFSLPSNINTTLSTFTIGSKT